MDISAISIDDLNHQLWLANTSIEVSGAIGSITAFDVPSGDILDEFDTIEDASFTLLFQNNFK